MNGSILVSLVITLFFAYFVFASMGYAHLAKLFPITAGAVMLILSLINLAQDIWRAQKNLDHDSGMGLADLETDWDIPHSLVWQRAGRFILSFVMLYLGIWVLGYPIAMSGFVALFYMFSVRTRTVHACLAGGAALGFIAMVAKLLNVTWPEGLISKVVVLPWPLG